MTKTKNIVDIKSGIIGIYKIKGISSFEVIKELRQKLKIKKIGHAGTLDPLAQGVLVVGIGKEACQSLFQIVKKEKEYLALIKFGFNSSTDDDEGEKEKIEIMNKPDLKEIKRVLKKFKGIFYQIPPIYSAIKISGKPAYKFARKKEKVILKKRAVEIKKIRILNYQWPYIKIKIISGPGFYVRALARDLGKELKIGGYLAELERIRVGDIKKKDCFII